MLNPFVPGSEERKCLFCPTQKTSSNGITTTLGFLCYPCVQVVHKLADQTVQLRERPQGEILADLDAEN